jgi:hypothetical protein
MAALTPYLLSAGGTLMQGQAADSSAASEAAQLNQQAGQERAVSQLDAITQRRSARYAQSRAQAVAAASGAGASDPTVVDVISGIAGEGEFQALTSLYTGEDRARGMEFSGKVRRREGKAAQAASYLKASGTLLSGESTWQDRYN